MMTTTQQNDWLTIVEVAEMLRVSRRTVQRWISTRQLRCLRTAPSDKGHVRIRRRDLETFLDSVVA